MTDPLKTIAAHALTEGEATPDEVQSLAASVLASKPTETRKSKQDLQRILSKIEGQEGQKERAEAIRKTLEEME